MKKLETEIIINARPEQVWAVLTDFARYPSWNPFVRAIDGAQRVGGRLVVRLQPPGSQAMTFQPIVQQWAVYQGFSWKGKLWVKGLFDGEHYFRLVGTPDGQTRFVHGENFSGILIGLLGDMLDRTKEGFEAMNQALKVAVEGQGAESAQ